MTPAERDQEQLGTMLHYCNRLSETCARFGNWDSFKTDTAYQDACALCIIQIGEAVNRLSPEFQERYPQIDWRRIYGMRCRLAHGYDAFDAEITWDAIETQIPPLRVFCEEHYEE